MGASCRPGGPAGTAGVPADGPGPSAPEETKKGPKRAWSKLITLLVILGGFLITQECLGLMLLAILRGYTSTAAWLTAAVGLAEAVIAAGVSGYLSLAKSDHSAGGITFESAKAAGFGAYDSTSPPV